ncbi:hypothetical protein NIZ91_12885 [Bacillus sp. 1780r2a1]|nr:hypothetical protein NIZ91_12885 [Bacillus sp. 1780r2a1]
MKEQLSSFVKQLKDSVTNAANEIQQKAKVMLSTDCTTVFELYEWVKEHPGTHIQKQSLLNFNYCFYSLKLDSASYYMETKDSYLLYMSIQQSTGDFFTYHSYKDSIHDKISMPFPSTQKSTIS